MPKYIEIKPKPIEPKRLTKSQTVDLGASISFRDLEAMIAEVRKQYGLEAKDFCILVTNDPDYCSLLELVFSIPESEAEYKARYEKYLQTLEEYSTWYKENKELIKKEEALRKQRILDKDKKELADLQKQVKQLEKKIERLNKA